MRKGTVSKTYFQVLKRCVLINVTTEGKDGAPTVMNQDDCVRIFFLYVNIVHKRGLFSHMYVCARLRLCKRVSVFVLPAPAVTECL